MHHEIGAFDAKTRLPELLRGVQGGDSFTITLRGVPIADLIPVQSLQRRIAIDAASQMKQFMLQARVKNASDVKSMIEEGRA